MMRIRWWLALWVVLVSGFPLPAQQVIYSRGYGPGYISGGSITYSRGRPGKGLSITLGSAGIRGGYVLDTLSPVWLPPTTRVTTIYYATPPVVVFAPPPLFEGLRSEPRPSADVPEEAELPVPGEARGLFRPLDPDNRERARRPLLPPKMEEIPPPKKEEPAPKKEEPKPPKKEEPPPRKEARPPEEPADEGAQLLDLGRASFAELEYGRAALRFRQAIRVNPREPLSHFLLAQALLAQGKYHEAYEAIRTGLDLWPDWPTVRFRPLLLYGTHVAEYPEHLRRLEATLERNPDDALLQFLSGYQLWIDGRREEARDLFLRARPRLPDPGLVEPFLRALPAAPLL
jgi:hypothetical protein